MANPTFEIFRHTCAFKGPAGREPSGMQTVKLDSVNSPARATFGANPRLNKRRKGLQRSRPHNSSMPIQCRHCLRPSTVAALGICGVAPFNDFDAM